MTNRLRVRIPWPGGLAGQFALVLVLALLAANVLAALLFNSERGRALRDARRFAQLERIVALVPALDTLTPDLRRQVLRATTTRRARLESAADPLVAATTANDIASALAAAIGERLEPPDTRDVRVALHAAGRRRWQRRIAGLDVSVRLDDGSWLNARLAPPRGPPAVPRGPVILTLGLSFAAVLAVGLLFAWRLVGPIRALEAAAVRAGRGDRDARAPERGPREVRKAAAAFNAMQAAMARFERERARTAAAVGHDLRTPITSLRIRAEMLDDEALRKPMVRTLDEMRVMADSLLQWGRAGAEAEPAETVDVAHILAGLCDEAQNAATYEGPASCPVRGRPVALRRALGNLLDNAHRYGDTANARIDERDATVTITISDDGPGMAEAQLEAVLEPFARGEESRSRDTGGTGLGLAIARDILREHGGTLTLRNRTNADGEVLGLEAVATLPTGAPRGESRTG